MRALRQRLSWAAATVAALCVAAGSLAAPTAKAQEPPETQAMVPPAQIGHDQRYAPAAVVREDQSDALATPVPLLPGQAAAPAMAAWFGCSTHQAERLDDGRSDAATIADALTTSCQPEWDASKAEACLTADLTPQACAMLSDKLDASRRSYEIKVVLASRARKAQDGAPP